MTSKDAVLILRKGSQQLVFPGPGGYRIEWSPGTKILPLAESANGHSVIPCDTYFKQNASAKAPEIAFWPNHLRQE
eukprot:10258155-Karenia_brevis.AAC.1